MKHCIRAMSFILLVVLFGCATPTKQELEAKRAKKEAKKLCLEQAKATVIDQLSPSGFVPDKYYYPVPENGTYKHYCKQYAKYMGEKDPWQTHELAWHGGAMTSKSALNKKVYEIELRRCYDIAKEEYHRCFQEKKTW